MKLKLLSLCCLLLATSSSTFAFEEDVQNQSGDFYEQAIPEYHVVNSGILRGGRPQQGDLALLKSYGVKTIVNIDDADQSAEKAEALSLGLNYVESPMSAFSRPNDAQVNKILAQLQDPKLRPVFLHCKHGQDRTGMIIGIYRVETDKWTAQDAYAEMKQYGFHSILGNLTSYFKDRTNY